MTRVAGLPPMASRPARLVITADGTAIRACAYASPADGVTPGPPTVVVLPPLVALQLAQDLLAAATRHLVAERHASRGGVRRGPP